MLLMFFVSIVACRKHVFVPADICADALQAAVSAKEAAEMESDDDIPA